MSKIHFVGGEKGGVGKSFTSRLLAQYYIDNQRTFAGFDTDQSHQTFSRFYGEFSKSITVSDFESLDQLFDSAESHPNRDMIVDLAAQTAENITLWEDASEPAEIFGLLGFDVFVWHVMDDGADSSNLLSTLLKRYAGKPVQLVVVQNLGRGENFDVFSQSSVYKDAVNSGACFLLLEKLQPAIAQKIDFNNASFWAAANNQDGLSIGERQRARVWLNRHYVALRNIVPLVTKTQEPLQVVGSQQAN